MAIAISAYVCSYAAARLSGARIAVPWSFLPLLLVTAFPFAFAVWKARDALAGRPLPFVAPLVAGCAAAWLYQQWYVWMAAALGALALRTKARVPWASVATALLIASLGYGALWNLNYLALMLHHGNLRDEALRALDLAAYSALLGGPVEYTGLFPIVRSGAGFRLLENGYLMLFGEVLLAIVISAEAGASSVRRFLRHLFSLYAAGVAIFLVYPAVGPCIRYPESFDSAYAGTLTFGMMDGMMREARALIAGAPLNGFGYFIAVPSLHVLVACFVQAWLWEDRRVRWFLLVPNALLIASTFLLGYHYIVDIPAAFAVFAVWLAIWKRRRPLS